MFTNTQIADESLPTISDVDWRPLHRSFVRQQQFRRVLLVSAVLVGAVVFQPFAGLPLPAVGAIASVAVALAIMYLLWPTIDFPRRGYALREHDMLHKHGVLFRTVTAVPFNRIQHVEISSNPLDRWFGIGSLKLFTAGGSGGDLSIHGLPLERAEQLRGHILGKVAVAVERD